jgi:hypothetical protein
MTKNPKIITQLICKCYPKTACPVGYTICQKTVTDRGKVAQQTCYWFDESRHRCDFDDKIESVNETPIKD